MTTKTTKPTEPVMSEELATIEVVKFINKYSKKPLNTDKFPDIVKDEYPNILDALCSGNLVIDDKFKPTYKLLYPIVAEDEKNNVNEIVFRTRVTPGTRADLADGLNLKTQAAKFSLRLMSYIIAQPVAMLDRFDTDDYDTISELAAVFMGGGR